MDATKIEVKMTLADLQAHQEAKQDLERRLVEVNRHLTEAKLDADPSGTTRDLVAGLEAAREVVSFAVAYLSPETVRGWPHEALTKLANVIASMPGTTTDHQAQAADWILFAREIVQLDEFRLHRERVARDARD